MVSAIRKALVPIVLAGLTLLLKALNVDVPTDTLQTIAAGIAAAIVVYAVPNTV